MTNTPALQSLLNAPWGFDPAFFIIWNRFRQLRRYLAYRPGDEARIFRLLDSASAGSPGHGPIHLLTQFADELGFFPGILSKLSSPTYDDWAYSAFS